MFGFSIKQIGITVGVGIISLIVLGSLIGGSEPEIQTSAPTSQSTQTNEVISPPKQPATQKVNDGTLLVTRVIDGDTIEIEGGQRIRYIGIDTPETVDPRKPAPLLTPSPASSTACTIKGNVSSSGEKIYHIEGCGSYNVTKINEARGERWFCTEEEAITIGWRKAKNCP